MLEGVPWGHSGPRCVTVMLTADERSEQPRGPAPGRFCRDHGPSESPVNTR